MSDFEVGDIVTHKSTMFPMVVVEMEGDIISCQWFVVDYNNGYHVSPVVQHQFRDFTLKKVDAEQVGW